KSDKVLGTVYMDLDWRVPVDDVRVKFQEIIEASDDWDRRAGSVLVTGSQGGLVTVRFLVSSADSGAQWRLRCLVREQIMTWLQQEHPEALPTTRVHLAQPLPVTAGARPCRGLCPTTAKLRRHGTQRPSWGEGWQEGGVVRLAQFVEGECEVVLHFERVACSIRHSDAKHGVAATLAETAELHVVL